MPKRIEYDREMMDELCDLMYGPDHFLSLAAASARLGLGPKRVMRILIDVGFPVPPRYWGDNCGRPMTERDE